MAFYLAFKEVWRNRGRFFLFSLVIALITTLVLFIAGLAQGLSNANKEYLSKLNAELIVFQDKVQLSSAASQIGKSIFNNVRRVQGVKDMGSIGLSSASVLNPRTGEDIDISLIGVEPQRPGMPAVLIGSVFRLDNENTVVVDQNFADETGLNVGDRIEIRSLQGKDYEYYPVEIIGITDGQEYLYRPSIFVPYLTWDKIRPQPATINKSEFTTNIIAIKVAEDYTPAWVAARIETQVPDLEVVDKKSAILAIPGYLVQQQTLNTQQGFTLLIGVLVIGGFFQIQMLQKIPLMGVLKAIGTPNKTVALAVVSQIVLVSTFGVLLGGLFTLLLSLGIPASVPIIFSGNSVALAMLALLAIGPLGGLVSVRLAVSVEPLTALGLTS